METLLSNKLLNINPSTLIIKQGEYGAWLFAGEDVFSAPAFLLEAKDPTGAGDSFAGGFLGYCAKHDSTDAETMRSAVIHGSALASFCVEGVGPARLLELTQEQVDERVNEFRRLVDFSHP